MSDPLAPVAAAQLMSDLAARVGWTEHRTPITAIENGRDDRHRLGRSEMAERINRIVTFVAAADKPTARQIADALRMDSRQRNDLYRLLRRLVESGQLERLDEDPYRYSSTSEVNQ